MTRSIAQLSTFAAGGAGTAVIGMITQEQLLAWVGVAAAVGAAIVSWVLSQRAKILEEQRRQDWADFLLDWRKQQALAGKLDPTQPLELPK
jgi:hypothetical protein